jgi:hypothetical protein
MNVPAQRLFVADLVQADPHPDVGRLRFGEPIGMTAERGQHLLRTGPGGLQQRIGQRRQRFARSGVAQQRLEQREAPEMARNTARPHEAGVQFAQQGEFDGLRFHLGAFTTSRTGS